MLSYEESQRNRNSGFRSLIRSSLPRATCLFRFYSVKGKNLLSLKKEQLNMNQSVHKRQNKVKTRGPWWTYIAHLSKQLCILTVEVSAKFNPLRFLYNFYSPAPKRPCFLSSIMMAWTESWKGITKGTILPIYIEIGPVVSDKKIFKMFYVAI